MYWAVGGGIKNGYFLADMFYGSWRLLSCLYVAGLEKRRLVRGHYGLWCCMHGNFLHSLPGGKYYFSLSFSENLVIQIHRRETHVHTKLLIFVYIVFNSDLLSIS